MGLVWDKHLSVGNELIDADHKNLFVAFNRMLCAIDTRDRAALMEAYELIEGYLPIHLVNEEKIAEAIRFPFAQNKLAHQRSVFELKEVCKKMEDTYSGWPGQVMNLFSWYLTGWMIDHIVKNDMRMKPALQAYPYNFKPE